MAHVLAQTSMGAVADNRLATATGLLGAALTTALALLMAHSMNGAPADDTSDTLPFTPGLVLALGSPQSEQPSEAPSVLPPSEPEPEPEPPTEATPSEPVTPEDAVTDDPTPAPPTQVRPPPVRPPTVRPPRPTAPPQTPSLPAPGSGAPPPGDPFGNPNGFDDLDQDGDPWARGLLEAIRAMRVGTIYAKPLSGTLRFQLTICKDGTVSRVAVKGGSSMSRDERDRVVHELSRLKIPRIPSALASKMKGRCAKVQHTFRWSEKGTQ
ncbi:MAG: hypothetical protein K0V04_12485 [Deltaproteobacteria bacterium]|nr:hypothetical protein [Deltaproteobacteria bacterium]